MSQPQIDGALVGGASLDASSFAQIVKYLTLNGRASMGALPLRQPKTYNMPVSKTQRGIIII